MITELLSFAGWALNTAGLPGFVRDCNYRATTSDSQVSVRRSRLFTIVTVNGLDIYFNRVTGFIDGVSTTIPQQAETDR